MIIIKYEQARQTVNLKTHYKEIENYITEDIEAMDTMGCHYQDEEGDFVVDELISGIYEYREMQQQIKEMLKIPFDVLIVIEREKAPHNELKQ